MICLARTRIRKYTKDGFPSLRRKKRFAEMKNRLLFICFVRKVISLDDFTDKHYKMTRILFVYLFMGPHRGRNFVHRMHPKWVPTFLANFLLIANSRVRMHVRCTVKSNMAGNPKISQNSEDGIFDGLTPWYFKMSPRRAPHSFTPTQ